jgi:hypothetical protein
LIVVSKCVIDVPVGGIATVSVFARVLSTPVSVVLKAYVPAAVNTSVCSPIVGLPPLGTPL